ncbi:roadblock/LC7 domain-containing protein [Flexivirga sp. B27]
MTDYSMTGGTAGGTTNGNGQYDWLVTRFVQDTPGVAHAVLVSVDGLVIARNNELPVDRAEQMAAVSSGLASLATGAAGLFDGGAVLQSIIEMQHGYVLLMSVGDGSHLAVLTAASADIGQIGYEMAMMVERVGRAVDAAPRA